MPRLLLQAVADGKTARRTVRPGGTWGHLRYALHVVGGHA
jgi:hypothetical protein